MRKILSIFVTVTLIANGLTFVSMPVRAAEPVKSAAVKFAGCATGNVLGAAASQQISKVVTKVEAAIAKRFRKKADVLTTVPVSDAEAQGKIETGNQQFITKAYVTDIIARCAAREILNAVIGNTFNIMRTGGRDGGVTFIKNWVNFQAQAQYRGENIFRAELSTAQLCGYLSDGIKKSFGVDPKTKTPITGQNTRIDSLQPFSLGSKCTLPTDFTVQKYQQNFAGSGGWDTFARLLQPQNNVYGLTALSQDEIQKQRALQVSADQAQAIAGRGYTGISGNGKAESCAVKTPNGADCIVYNKIKTTGSYIADNVAASINAELSWITSAQSLGSMIAFATEVLLNRMLDQGNPDEGSYRQANDANIEITIPGVTETTPTTTQPFCTANGQAEQNFMLPKLNGGESPQSVADQTNQQFGLRTGGEAVYYPDSNTVGLPEFYAAGPMPNRPVSPSTGQPWDIVSRCTAQSGSTTPGTGTNGGINNSNEPPPAI